MDHAQEQADEIEALESIYAGGLFEKLADAPPKVAAARTVSAFGGAACARFAWPSRPSGGENWRLPGAGVQVRVAVDPEAAAERRGDSAEVCPGDYACALRACVCAR